MSVDPLGAGPDEAGKVVAVILAAGEGRRFGGGKQLAPLHGRALVEHALAAAAAGPASETVLVLGAAATEIEAGIRTGDARVVRCRDWARGPAASLRAGLEALDEGTTAVLVTLGDEPFVSPEASRRLLAARRPGLAALRASYRGRPGHPVLIERGLFAAMIDSPAEVKPAELLERAGIESVECGDLGEPTDVDTPEQLAALERLGVEEGG
ncbi:MAG: nucleotidyltransferase family protein [Solirubrobacterales bacterium]